MIRKPLYYGWVIVGIGVVLMVLIYATRHSFSVFFPPILEEFGWSRGSTAFMLSLNLLVYGFTAPVAGSLADRWKPKLVMIIGIIILGLALGSCSFSTELWHFYLLFGVLIPVGMAFSGWPIENQVFVVSSSWYLKPEDIPPELKDIMKFNLAIGSSCVINPAGLTIAGPVFECETIVHAEIDLSERELAKVYLDGLGHYSRPDLLSLNIRDEAWTPTGPETIGSTESAISNRYQLLDIIERYNITPAELEALLATTDSQKKNQ